LDPYVESRGPNSAAAFRPLRTYDNNDLLKRGTVSSFPIASAKKEKFSDEQRDELERFKGSLSRFAYLLKKFALTISLTLGGGNAAGGGKDPEGKKGRDYGLPLPSGREREKKSGSKPAKGACMILKV